jgi:hypothetical protein
VKIRPALQHRPEIFCPALSADLYKSVIEQPTFKRPISQYAPEAHHDLRTGRHYPATELRPISLYAPEAHHDLRTGRPYLATELRPISQYAPEALRPDIRTGRHYPATELRPISQYAPEAHQDLRTGRHISAIEQPAIELRPGPQYEPEAPRPGPYIGLQRPSPSSNLIMRISTQGDSSPIDMQCPTPLLRWNGSTTRIDSRSTPPRTEVVLLYDQDYPGAFGAVKARNSAARLGPIPNDLFILDTGATTSCATSLRLLQQIKVFQDDESVEILGINGKNPLIAPCSGYLTGPFVSTPALYVPDASANILSWWGIKTAYKIDIVDQDLDSEHVLLSHKATQDEIRCYIDPALGLYVYRPSEYDVRPRCLSLSHVRTLQKLGLPKAAASRAAACQDLHETLGFCNPGVLRDLIHKRGNKGITPADVTFWEKYYHPNYCRGCPARQNAPPQVEATTRASDQMGDLVFADLFEINSAMLPSSLTAIAFLDEATGHKHCRVIPDKSIGAIMDETHSLVQRYKRGEKRIKRLRTDGEPTFVGLTAPLFNTYDILHEMSEPYRHCAPIERAIQTIERKFLAVIHGADVPIPVFLYPELLAHVCDMDNSTFNAKNDGLTPVEHLQKSRIEIEDLLLKQKFGSLRSYHNPRPSEGSSSKKSDEPRHSYGVYIGLDPVRPHCHVLWNFLELRRHSVAHSVHVLWDPILEAAYLKACDGHVTSDLPYFADCLAAGIESGQAEPLASVPPTASNDKPTITPQDTLRAPDMDVESPGDPIIQPVHDAAANRMSMDTPAPLNISIGGRKSNDDALALAKMSAKLSTPTPRLGPRRPPATVHNTNRKRELFNRALADAEEDQKDSEALSNALNTIDSVSTDHSLINALTTLIDSTDDAAASEIVNSIRRSSRFSKRKAQIDAILNLSIKKASETFPDTKVSAAVLKELDQMDTVLGQDVWDYVTPAQLALDFQARLVKNIIPSSLFLKLKSDCETLKARLIVHGDKQILSELFSSNSSPTINTNILMTVLSIAAKESYDFEAVDITGAYLNASLPEAEYMRLPRDIATILVQADASRAQFLQPDGTIVVRLKKALYGLKNSGKLWYEEMHQFLINTGFARSLMDKCLYTRRDGNLVTHALVYVDDILLVGNDTKFRLRCKTELRSRFKNITEQPLNNIVFLGMSVTKQANGDISVDQRSMISDIISDYKVTSTSTAPASANILNHHVSDVPLSLPKSKEYRSLNMKLLYLATRTRPDILFPSTVFATRSKCPSAVDYDRLIKIIEYLNGSQNNVLTFKKEGDLKVNAFVDSSFNAHWDAKGHTGFAIFPDLAHSAAIIIKSSKHKSTADSSTEAELMALHEAMLYITWIADIYSELGYNVRPVETFQDNLSCIALSSAPILNFSGRSKFINRKLFGIYEHLEQGDAILTHVGTDDMIADVLTKAIVGSKFRKFTIALMGQQADN